MMRLIEMVGIAFAVALGIAIYDELLSMDMKTPVVFILLGAVTVIALLLTALDHREEIHDDEG